ncbi:MAG: NADH-quinone oxidoreductase subunit J, partial [Methylovirgula sp.]
LILLVAMIGAIVLTLRHKKGIKRQRIELQNERTAKSAVELKKQPSRAGI